jgi:hypothetical protein
MLARRLAAFVLLAGAVVPSAPLAAQEKCFLMVFGSQTEPRRPRTSHTWAVFVKATSDAGDIANAKLESRTISWLPESKVILPRVIPERGRNFELEETLQWARALNARISMWGPYEIEGELYELAQRKIERLQNGSVSYRIFTTSLRPGAVSNCIHAVCDVDERDPLFTGTAYGDAASIMAARHLGRWMRDPQTTHDWLYDRFKLKDYDVVKRGSW